MKKLFYLLVAFISMSTFRTSPVHGQGVGINSAGNAADPSSMIDISSTSKGALIPRMTTAQRDLINTPAEALLIFNLTTKCLEIYMNGVWQPFYCAIAVPGTAGAISGSSTVCLGQNNVAFSVPAIQYATYYVWNYSGTGATIVGTGNTVTINFSMSATSGNLTVSGVNSLGNGPVSANFSISVNAIASSAGSIIGTSTVCQGQNGVVYAVNPIANATSYNWSYTGAGITINGQSNSITIDFSNAATSGYLTVIGVSPCGNGNVSTNYPIIVDPLPASAGNISGSSTVCQGQNVVPYSVASISNASSYQWVYTGTGATINGSSNSITIDFSSSATAGNLTVRGINSCGNGTISSSFPISVNPGTSGTQTFNYSGNIVNFTIPSCVFSLTIDAYGAAGGTGNQGTPTYGGSGARMKGTFAVNPGDVLKILAGQKGNNGVPAPAVGGGGGGSFVWNQATSLLLIAAGGGGGGSYSQGTYSNGKDAVITTNGTNGSGLSNGGGIGGNGGSAPSTTYYGGGGAGWLTNGCSASCGTNAGGTRPLDGGSGGACQATNGDCTYQGPGGFGGGGSGTGMCSWPAGGGGGYSGGGPGAVWIDGCCYNFGGGGGGGSYNGGTNPTNTAGVQSGNGQVIIAW